MKLNSKKRLSLKSIFIALALMISGIFGQCSMVIDSLMMNHTEMAEGSSSPCDGICNTEDVKVSQKFALLKEKPLEVKIVTHSPLKELPENSFARYNILSGQLSHNHLPPGTSADGLRLQI